VTETDARTDAADVLRRCRMPEDEIRWVLTADDPAVVHMILELHRERLEEELAERRKALGLLEARLTASASVTVPTSDGPTVAAMRGTVSDEG
jgi:hypothetical protein